MRLARAARAVLVKSPTSDPKTGPLAELATVNAENVRLRSELAAANEQLSAHLLNCEAPASAKGPVAPAAQSPACTKLLLPNADEASLKAARCWDRALGLSPRWSHSQSVPLVRARHAGLGRRGSRGSAPLLTSYTTRCLALALQLPDRPRPGTRLLSRAAGAKHSPTPASPSRTQ